MNAHIVFLVLQVLAGASLFCSSFCRLRHISNETIAEIRFAVWLQSVSSLTVIVAPFLPLVEPAFCWPPGETPIEVWVGIVITSAFIQIATARHWMAGVPWSYTKPEHRPMRRASEIASKPR